MSNGKSRMGSGKPQIGTGPRIGGKSPMGSGKPQIGTGPRIGGKSRICYTRRITGSSQVV